MKMPLGLLFFLLLLSCLYPVEIVAQNVNQTVKGHIADEFKTPLEGASVKITGSQGEFQTTSDAAGKFLLSAPVGRYQLSISFTGFESIIEELLIIAGKQAVIDRALHRKETVLQTVEIASVQNLTVPGLQSIPIEKTLRVPANFFDPVRMVTTYPGVIAANDQNNSIVIRGNSPNGLLWRLNGLDIVNPNHLANAGTFNDRPAASGGGVNILSAQMLDRTDFYMGMMPSRYGNALSGVIDMNLREGNKSDHEFTAQASLIGLDFAAEGPFIKKGNSSFLANYRYSTVGLLSAAGVDFGGEAITFQDFSFNTDFDIKTGALTVFGLWGASKNVFKAREFAESEADKDFYNIDYDAQTFAGGLTYRVPIKDGSFSTGLAYSGSDQNRFATLPDSTVAIQRVLIDDAYGAANSVLSTSLTYQKLLGGNTAIEGGVMANFLNNTISVTRDFECAFCSSTQDDQLHGDVNGLLLQPYFNISAPLLSGVSLDAGLRYVHFSYNESRSVEPRVLLTFKSSERSDITASYSLTSQVQLPQIYLATNNHDLGLTKTQHVDIGYQQNLTSALSVRTNVFYQFISGIPVERSSSSTFSTLNLIEGLPPGDLINNGTGENYGVDVTLEKQFFGEHYLVIGGTFYESTYKGGDGVKRDTRFNGNYTANAVYGKEWLKQSKNRSIGLSSRLLYVGGFRESDIDLAETFSRGETVYSDHDPFNNKLPDYIRMDVRISFRKNKPGYTRTFAIDIQNLTSQQNESLHYYDFSQKKIATRYQLGIIPVLVYRIDF